jgi:hypothetical protein
VPQRLVPVTQQGPASQLSSHHHQTKDFGTIRISLLGPLLLPQPEPLKVRMRQLFQRQLFQRQLFQRQLSPLLFSQPQPFQLL